ncbi:unnamed protein product [Rhizophagus irregularis]|uniref:Uncharacterized protein n=1 Tax=Rhizophagus irregularis TaxID=588596 RepID=A0A2I1GTE2_9GLOM|nr:hypothetical protein RhiirA4_466041 [Rhizophagus irregularis]CAB4420063.1 unnamed protein product [Rhizophagus irregularis]
MELKVKISKERLNELRDKMKESNEIIVKFYDDDKECLEEWDVTYEIVIKEFERVAEKEIYIYYSAI